MLKHIDAAELCVHAAEVLAVDADAMFVAHHLPKNWCPSGCRSGPPACIEISLEEATWRRERVEEQKAGRSGETEETPVWQFGMGNKKRRWRAYVYPERGNVVVLPLQHLEL
jgi:hypothetical protein